MKKKNMLMCFLILVCDIVFCITGTGKNNRGFQGNEQKDVFGGI